MEPASRSARQQALREGRSGTADVDWQAILDQAGTLAATGRDLRLLVIVVRALANDAGLDGLTAGLTLLTRTVTGFWDNVHPTLRESPSRREAALRRINALHQIENVDNGILGDLEFNTVLAPRGLGAVSGGDLATGGLTRGTVLAEGPQGLGQKEQDQIAAEHEARVSRVTAACRATAAEHPEEMAALQAGLAATLAALATLEAALTERAGENGIAVRFDALRRLLTRMSQTLAAHQGTPTAPEEGQAMQTTTPGTPGTPAASPTGAALPGQINSRRDVERCLDMIIDFYERSEPASPIPHLARRMRKMVPMNFLQLMEEIAPSGMKEFRSAAGVLEEKAK